MLKAITEWMNGDYAGKTMLVLRFVFFLLFIVTSFAVCFGGGLRKKGGESRFAVLSVVTVLALADSGVELSLNFWISRADYFLGQPTALELAKQALENAGIEIPFPQLTVHGTDRSK